MSHPPATTNAAPASLPAPSAPAPAAQRGAHAFPPLWRLDALLAVILISLTALAWLGVVSPALTRSRTDMQARDMLPDARRAVAVAARSVSNVQTSLNRTTADLAALNQPCWTDFDRSSRVEQIYTTAAAADLRIEAVEPGEPELVSNRKGYAFRVSSRGTYASLAATLAELRRTMPDVILRSLQITAAAGDDRPEIVVQLELLWLPLTDTQSPTQGPHQNPLQTPLPSGSPRQLSPQSPSRHQHPGDAPLSLSAPSTEAPWN